MRQKLLLAGIFLTLVQASFVLAEEESSNVFWWFLAILFLGIGGFLWYSHSNKKTINGMPKHVIDYITMHIQSGKKHHHIKHSLKQAGWKEEDIDKAYKATMDHNYSKYQKSGSEADRRKQNMIKIIGVSAALLVAVIFALTIAGGGSKAGKAIHLQDSYAHDKPFLCTPPHIDTAGGCCLDKDNNSVCDVIETREAKKPEVSKTTCTDHIECVTGEQCINEKCVVPTRNAVDCPTKRCRANAFHIKIRNDDSERYITGEGSYTSAGALAWSIKQTPIFCEGDTPEVPIEFESRGLVCYDFAGSPVSCDQETDISCTTETDCANCLGLYGVACSCTENVCVKKSVKDIQSEVVNKEIVTLAPGQTSKTPVHPIPEIHERLKGFTLTLDKVEKSCFK